MSLFEPNLLADEGPQKRPLAERMRPKTLDEFVGQEHILGAGKPLRMQIERDALSSMILWGPPGVGKTTLAQLVARITRCDFVPFSAVMSGIKEIKAVMADAERNRRLGRRTVMAAVEALRKKSDALPKRDAALVQVIGECETALGAWGVYRGAAVDGPDRRGGDLTGRCVGGRRSLF